MAKGRIIAISDHGTLVQFQIRDGKSITVCYGDGNQTRRAIHQAFQGRHPVGKCIEYEVESWGGLKHFRLLDGEEADGVDGAEAAPRRGNRRRE